MKEADYEFYVAGVKFHELHKCIKEIEGGTNLSMTLEPTNKFDPNAVRLEFQSLNQNKTFMVGYVPAKLSATISAAVETDTPQCLVTEVNPDEKPWKQLKVAIFVEGDGQ